MKRFLIQFVIYSIVSSSAVFGAPDPRDSVIIESKTVAPTNGQPSVYVKIYITNKDSLANITLALRVRSLTGGAYMTLAWPRTFNGVVRRLTATLPSFGIFNGKL